MEEGDSFLYLSELRRIALGEVPMTDAMKNLLEIDVVLRTQYEEMITKGVVDVQSVDTTSTPKSLIKKAT